MRQLQGRQVCGYKVLSHSAAVLVITCHGTSYSAAIMVVTRGLHRLYACVVAGLLSRHKEPHSNVAATRQEVVCV